MRHYWRTRLKYSGTVLTTEEEYELVLWKIYGNIRVICDNIDNDNII